MPPYQFFPKYGVSVKTYPAAGDGPLPPEAYLLVVGGAVPPVESVPPPLGVAVEGEAPLAAVVDGEGRALRPEVGAGVGAAEGDSRHRLATEAQGLLCIATHHFEFPAIRVTV